MGENHPTVDGAVEVEVAVAAVEPLSHRQLLAQVCRDLLTGTSARACSATAVASARSPQVRLRRLRSHLQLLHRCQHHGDDDEPCPCWAHNPAECKVPFLEPSQNHKAVPSDVAGVLQLTEFFALPHSQKT